MQNFDVIILLKIVTIEGFIRNQEGWKGGVVSVCYNFQEYWTTIKKVKGKSMKKWHEFNV